MKAARVLVPTLALLALITAPSSAWAQTDDHSPNMRLVARFDESGPLVTRWLPLTSSAAMTLLGAAIAVQALASGALIWKLT